MLQYMSYEIAIILFIKKFLKTITLTFIADRNIASYRKQQNSTGSLNRKKEFNPNKCYQRMSTWVLDKT